MCETAHGVQSDPIGTRNPDTEKVIEKGSAAIIRQWEIILSMSVNVIVVATSHLPCHARIWCLERAF